MRPSEVIHARVDALTEGLSTAVRKTSGAQFALMLSMISESQQLATRLDRPANQEAGDRVVENRDDLYSADIVGRLNTALRSGSEGDLQMLLSWLETVPLEGRFRAGAVPAGDAEAGVPLSQAAVLAGQYAMLDEIKESRLRLAA